MNIDFEKQKSFRLNGTLYLIEDIKGFTSDSEKQTITLKLKDVDNKVVIQYFNHLNFRNDCEKIRQLGYYWDALRKKYENELYAPKGLLGITNKLKNQKTLEEAQTVVGEKFLIKTKWIFDSNLTPLEFRFLCLLELMRDIKYDENLCNILVCTLNELVDTVKNLKTKGYLKE